MATPSAYCTESDIYNVIPSGSLPNPGRQVSSVVTSTDIIIVDGHGLALDDDVLFRAEAGGTLPAELVEGTTFFAIPQTSDTFKVAATAGGSAIDLTTAGDNIIATFPLPIDAAIEWASAMVNDFIIAHGPILTGTIPAIVVQQTAELAAIRLLTVTGGAGRDDVELKIERAQKILDRWTRSVLVRGPNQPAIANRATVALVTATDPLGWYPEDVTLP